ncbi:MAG TPA: fibronectin type III domain-containing protein, partial [Planctomycetota bacterium]
MTLLLALLLQGIEARDRCVLVSAEPRAVPPRLGLRWPADPKAVEYTVYRRGPGEAAWGGARGRVETGATAWDDDDVKPGESYEYKVLKTAKAGDQVFEGTGYLRAAVEARLVDVRGKVLLLVDATHAAALAVELKRLERDLEGDGWTVARREVDPTSKAADVKALVKAETGLRSVFLLGRLPVVRSGFMTPDGHPDHLGAWPADAYYGDLDGEWSDAAVNKPEGKNVPGDGKLDPSRLPSEVELEVGRVDLSRMPAFGKPEVELLRRYLDRNHAFRHKKLEAERRALICDQFGDFRGEAFVSGSWRNFGALVGASKIETGPYFEKLTAGTYLWAH